MRGRRDFPLAAVAAWVGSLGTDPSALFVPSSPSPNTCILGAGLCLLWQRLPGGKEGSTIMLASLGPILLPPDILLSVALRRRAAPAIARTLGGYFGSSFWSAPGNDALLTSP